MNLEEISKISDNGLREIRMKYWNLRHKAFLDEHNISDSELKDTWDKLTKEEELEVTTYLKKQDNA